MIEKETKTAISNTLTTKELIKILKRFPDVPIRFIYDGAVRGDVCHVFLSKGGDIVLGDDGDDLDPTDEPMDLPVNEQIYYKPIKYSVVAWLRNWLKTK
jgi:hypothetical protein